MLIKPRLQQINFEILTFEQLVRCDHPLRKVDAAIDFGFIAEMTEELCRPDNGRPPNPPEQLFNALFVG